MRPLEVMAVIVVDVRDGRRCKEAELVGGEEGQGVEGVSEEGGAAEGRGKGDEGVEELEAGWVDKVSTKRGSRSMKQMS
jgi:hypothetical protein